MVRRCHVTSDRRGALLLGRRAIRLVAIAASLGNRRKGRLELIDRLGLALTRCHGLAEGVGLGVEIGLVLPDFRQRTGVGTGWRRRREQRRDLLCRRAPIRESRIGFRSIEGLLALHHLGHVLGMGAVRLHQFLALRDRIGLGEEDSYSTQKYSRDKNATNHKTFSLFSGLVPSGQSPCGPSPCKPSL